MTVDTGPQRPSVGLRIAAALRGWVRTDDVLAYRRAGGLVYEQLLAAEATRQRLLLAGEDLRTASPGTRSELVCTWNAFALQSLGEAFLDAAPAEAGRLPGYLPRMTVVQATVFLADVGYWSSQARRAALDPAYDVGLQRLPAPLPAWIESRPCPIEHVQAMLAAGATLRDKSEAALADFHRAQRASGTDHDASTLAGLAADADTALAYATAMFSPDARQPVHEALEQSVRRAVESYYRLGQILAAPVLLDQHAGPPLSAYPDAPYPGQPYPGVPYGEQTYSRRNRGGC